ncbi:hypothetical protein [Synoicihabitans lomoniglobus]|uniref:Uncharacterized protein n=1 Tax=Synoicihabitans lomoniglobus TaxID=2909285 RepID=A0AAF0CSH6_9BACT|nr:hypothetical protein [Opitutaceae bacterium LMO-M01]WED67283.1 hypothetical protein PXH66_10520 [Opitutaceae bacterium LMO-M01]
MNFSPRSRRRPSRSSRTSKASSRATNLSPELLWHHNGQGHRVTLWPEVAFEKELSPGLWRPYTPDVRSDSFCTGAVSLTKRHWQAYLEFCPVEWSQLIQRFSFHRLHALAALAYCPALTEDILEHPVLALVAAAHSDLRSVLPEWGELNAVRERSTIFEVLGWLGLPPTRACIDHLDQLDPDLPVRDLRRVRDVLWQHHEASARPLAPASHGHALAA